jgi:RNA polymerase sigma-70 factor (ECF subfamily)
VHQRVAKWNGCHESGITHREFDDTQDDFQTKLQCARSGSRYALGDLLHSCLGILIRVATARWGDRCMDYDPLDLVQATFLEAVRDFHRFRGNSPDEFLAWLRGILLHNVRDAQRSSRRGRLSRSSDLGANGSLEFANYVATCKTAAHNETVWLLHRVLGELPDRYRRTIELHLFHERTFKEIADEWGCSPDAVRKLWIRALRQVGRKMKQLI